MKPILSSAQIRLADAYTIEHLPIASIDLMERAAAAATQAIVKRFKNISAIDIYCGKGNNGGDGLAIARLISERINCCINIYIIDNNGAASKDFTINLERLAGFKNVKINTVIDERDLIKSSAEAIIIDALLGTGLNKTASGIFSATIQHINQHLNQKVSIDIPSGMFADCSEMEYDLQNVVKADVTLSFQFYKECFLYQETAFFAGEIEVLDIGIIVPDLEEFRTKNYLMIKESLMGLLPNRQRFSHKGNYGHAVIFAGSTGKTGAVVLAAKACSRAGAGLLTVHTIASAGTALNITLPSAMTSIDADEKMITSCILPFNYTAIAIGPGIGEEQSTSEALKQLIQQTKVPLIIDADAINILAENQTWLSFIPTGCIFTPHPKEFERLVGKWTNNIEKNELLKDFCAKYNCYVILKGAHTCICTPGGVFYFNTTGNPGMAKGGSGDVLTGILTGFYAQGLHALKVCLLAVYVHGLAGDIAKNKYGEVAMLPEDLTDQIGNGIEQMKSIEN